MFKFLAIGVFLWQYSLCLADNTERLVENTFAGPIILAGAGKEQEKVTCGPPIREYIYVNITRAKKDPPEAINLGLDYKVITGTGAFKLFTSPSIWSLARKSCNNDHAHLAVVDSIEEQNAINKMMEENKVDSAWLGYHKMFKAGEWSTLFDQLLERSEWLSWTKLLNSNNKNKKKNCAAYNPREEDLDAKRCNETLPFICKISFK